MSDAAKTCFVIGPIGQRLTPVYQRALALLEHVIVPAIKPFGYVIVRADQIPTSGILQLQIAAQLIQADLVVADLTGANPNVYYELGIRHTLGKPCVQLLPVGEQLPFDTALMRTIIIDDQTPAGIRAGVDAIQAQVSTIATPLLTPVSILVNVTTTARDGALLQAAATIGTPGPTESRRPLLPAAGSDYRLEEHPLFWDSLLKLDAAGESSGISRVVSAMLNRVMARPTSATISNGVYVVRTQPALVDGVPVPGLRLAYALGNDVIELLHIEPDDPFGDDDGGANTPPASPVAHQH
jgi:hypothetical protein